MYDLKMHPIIMINAVHIIITYTIIFFNNLIEFLCLTHRKIFLFQTTYKLGNTYKHRMKRLF